MKHLDGMRGIAVLMVLVSHANVFGLILHPLIDFNPLGKIGVYLFFILSAYLLDKQIIEVLVKGIAGQRFWINYIFRRCLRIFPLMFLSLCIYYILTKTIVDTFIIEKSDIWHHLVFTKGRFFYWSIPVEFKYYLASPLILIICNLYFKWSLKKSFILILGLIIFSLSVGYVFGHVKFSTLRHLPIFLTGTSLVLIEKFAPQKINLNYNYLALFSICGLFLMEASFWK